MVVIKWDPNLEIGEKVIDSQHKKLLAQINQLHDAYLKGETGSVIEGIIGFLDRYVKEHFDYEEKFMKENGFLGLERHKEAHDGFEVKYKDFKKKLMSGVDSSDLAVEVEVFLGEWWINHIGTLDQKYADEIIRKE
jgi:hemerythrin